MDVSRDTNVHVNPMHHAYTLHTWLHTHCYLAVTVLCGACRVFASSDSDKPTARSWHKRKTHVKLNVFVFSHIYACTHIPATRYAEHLKSG
jgi:hypothetical protein